MRPVLQVLRMAELVNDRLDRPEIGEIHVGQ